jgi:hypothetical protein
VQYATVRYLGGRRHVAAAEYRITACDAQPDT